MGPRSAEDVVRCMVAGLAVLLHSPDDELVRDAAATLRNLMCSPGESPRGLLASELGQQQARTRKTTRKIKFKCLPLVGTEEVAANAVMSQVTNATTPVGLVGRA